MKTKTIVEYEDAPSGSVCFYNYKEPLIKFDGGFGYLGAVIFDASSDKVQCHFCGEWYIALGNHLHKEHNMTAEDYKRSVGLNKNTALIGEQMRAKLIASGLKKRMKNLRPGGKHSKATRKKISDTLKENRDEMQNLRGTCPVQLLDRLVAISKKVGRTPTTEEVPFIETLRKVYGTYTDACRLAGLEVRPRFETLKTIKSVDVLVKKVADFIRNNEGQLPTSKDLHFLSDNNSALFKRLRTTRREILSRALAFDGIYRHRPLVVGRNTPPRSFGRSFYYTKEELLRFMVTFEKSNGRRPSVSDAKRRLIPYPSRYIYHFGSWPNALKAAFGA